MIERLDPGPDDPVDPLLRRLLGYWRERCGGRPMPSRADIDPLDMHYLIGRLMLVDVRGWPPAFHVRLHGTQLARRLGFELTGKTIAALPRPDIAEVARRDFTLVVERKLPLQVFRDRLMDQAVHSYEALILPLSRDGAAVDMLLVAMHYRS